MGFKNIAVIGFACGMLTACGSNNPTTSAEDETSNEQSQSAPPIEAFVGKTPFDEIDGTKFLNHPTVIETAKRLLSNDSILNAILSPNNVFVPIENQNGFGIISYGCESENCTGKNWSIFIGTNGNQDKSYVCYYDSNDTQSSGFYSRYGKGESTGDCGKPVVNNNNNYVQQPDFTAEKKAGKREMYPEVFATNLNDGQIELNEVIFNRGNCEIFYVAKNEISETLPITLSYGDKLTMRGSCDPSEINFVTSIGTATVNWR